MYNFIMKIEKKQKLKQMAVNYSSDIDSKYFMNLNGKRTPKLYFFLNNDTFLVKK